MHDVAVFRVATEDVGDDFAKGVGIQALVKVLDGVVDVFLFGGNAALTVAIVHVFFLLWLMAYDYGLLSLANRP